MIGRGVADDKGPMVATLYALKFLKEEGVSLRYPIRALVGDNEETHMHDVDYYLANYPAPVFCFTPDAEFPVCNGEKGHFDGKLVSPVCNGIIKDFVGASPPTLCLTAPALSWPPTSPSCATPPTSPSSRKRRCPHPRLGQVRPCCHAGRHGQRHRSGGELPAGQWPLQRRRARYLEAVKKLHDSTAGVGLGHRLCRRTFGR